MPHPQDKPSNVESEANDIGTISLIAGLNSEGEPIVEQVTVSVLPNKAPSQAQRSKQYRLEKSPVFVRNLACGDTIAFPSEAKAGFDLIRRSGNLSIRVFNKGDIEALSQWLTPELELLDGKLEIQSPHILSYSIHVSIGFSKIEALLDKAVGQFPNTVWYYGNVYDPEDGVTPLNWWQEFLAPV